MKFPSADVPLVLLPIRLETRFRGDSLLVRFFPDDVHVTRHEAGLSQGEIDAGVRHAEAGSTAAGREELERTVGVGRALWVIEAFRPYAKWVKGGRRGAPPLPPVRTVDAGVRAVALPRCFRVVGYLGDEKVLESEGAPVTSEPQVLPQGRSGDLPFDEATRWLHDFDAALSAGLAMSVPLGPRASDIRQRGLTRLLAFGLAEGTPQQGAAALADLFEAQRFDRGADFMPVGAPTNHTGEASSEASTAGHDRAKVLAHALGVPRNVFAWPRAGGSEEDEARAIVTALWPATWGAYLGQWMNVPEETVAWVRQHAEAHLRPLGPLPSLRIGKQPYGVLPITSLDDLSGESPPESDLVTLLQRLRHGPFATAVTNVPQLSSPGSTGVVHALERTAVSQHLAARPLFGRQYLRNLYQLLRAGPAGAAGPAGHAQWLDERRAKALSGYRALGLPGTPRLASSVYAGKTVAAPSTLESEDPFFALLAHGGLAELKAAEPSSMLGRLLRLAGLRLALDLTRRAEGGRFTEEEWLTSAPLAALPDVAQNAEWRAWLAAARLLAAAPAERRSLAWRALFDASSHRLDAWITSLASRRLAAVRAERPKGAVVGAYGWVENLHPESAAPASGYIHAPTPRHAATAALLAAGHRAHRAFGNAFQLDLSSARVRRALDVLEAAQQGRSVGEVLGEQLERRLIALGHGGVISKLREAAPTSTREPQLDGSRLVDLYRQGVVGSRATIEVSVSIEALDADRVPLVDRAAEWGLALTREGRLAFHWRDPERAGQQEVVSERAVELGAWRHLAAVRDGAQLNFFIDAEPAGEADLGTDEPFIAPEALLTLGGIGFVGRMREARLWSDVRSGTQLVSSSLAGADEPEGPGLIARWPLDDTSSGTCRDAVGRRDGRLTGGCAASEDASVRFDGTGSIQIGGSRDLHLGWSRAVDGVELDAEVLLEIDRISDATDAMADLVVAESIHQWADGRLDRAGALVRAFEEGHSWPAKLDVLSDQPSRRTVLHRLVVLRGKEPVRKLAAHQLRARVSPNLEGLAADFLGPWDALVVGARFFDSAGKDLGFEERRLAALGLSSLDLVFGATANGAAWPEELATALTHRLFELRRASRKRAVRAELVWDARLDQLLDACCAVWRFLTAARPLRPADVTWPARQGPNDPPATTAAADAVEATLRAHLVEMNELLRPLAWTTRHVERAHQALFAAWSAGAAGVVAAPDADEAALRSLLHRASEDTLRRLEAGAAEPGGGARFSALVGHGMRHLPDLELGAAEAKALDAAAFTDATARSDARRWFRQAARVRGAAQALSDAILCADALDGSVPKRWEPLHLPRGRSERWIGVDTASSAELSIVTLKTAGLTWAKAKQGLLLDAWSEHLPASEQTTGVTFHYDAPGAAPPQTLLVAVTPSDDRPWSADLLADTVGEALALAKLRGVTWTEVPELHHYLPAVLLPHDSAPDTLSVEP